MELTRYRLSQLLLVSGPLITLIIGPTTNYDPISLVKMVALSTISFSILFMGSQLGFLKSVKEFRVLAVITLSFIVFSISTFFFSGAPWDQQFWGQFGRNTGLLTYLSFVPLIFLSATKTFSDFGEKVLKYLIATAVPMSIYCLIQISGNDPVTWSSFDTFGTLGNINFLSAFLGLSTIASLSVLTLINFEKKWKLLSIFLILIDIPIIWSTGSIQGLMMIVAGISTILFFKLSTSRNAIWKLIPYSFVVVMGFVATILGLRNKGPLATFLYQPSVTFREDYMHAGWEMTIRNPIFGVGMDSYGDWYREVRGEISTLRTGPDRIANTAHNIFLDVSSNGGVPLGVAFISIFVYCLYRSLKYTILSTKIDTVFVGLFSTWIGYLLQALISINQIGVGIWGVLLTGGLLSHIHLHSLPEGFTPTQLNSPKSRKLKGQLLSPKTAILSIAGAFLGFVLAFPAFRADIAFMDAASKGTLQDVVKSSDMFGATVFYKEMALERALKEDGVIARQIALDIISSNPRSYFAWGALSILTSSSLEEVSQATENLNRLDPFNPRG